MKYGTFLMLLVSVVPLAAQDATEYEEGFRLFGGSYGIRQKIPLVKRGFFCLKIALHKCISVRLFRLFALSHGSFANLPYQLMFRSCCSKYTEIDMLII